MSELLQEIEDDIRQERLDRLWHHIGKFMIGASIAVILVTAGVVMVQNHKQSVAMEQTGQFITGLDQLNAQDYKGAMDAFARLSADESSPYYGLAMLRKAQTQSASGDKDGAAKTYQQLAAQDTVFGALAKMHNPDAIAMPDKHSPLYYSLAEWKGWQLMHVGKKDEAVEQFLALRDDADAPYAIRQRMQDVVQQLAPEKNEMKDKKLTDDKIEGEK